MKKNKKSLSGAENISPIEQLRLYITELKNNGRFKKKKKHGKK